MRMSTTLNSSNVGGRAEVRLFHAAMLHTAQNASVRMYSSVHVSGWMIVRMMRRGPKKSETALGGGVRWCDGIYV
jgi:hypothetical protein